MDSSLFLWLEKACELIYGEENAYEVQTLSLEGRIITVGSDVLGLPPRTELIDVVEKITSAIGMDLNVSMEQIILIEALLIVALSETCTDRVSYVNAIMEMDQSVQQELMIAIQGNLSRHGLYCADEDATVDCTSTIMCMSQGQSQGQSQGIADNFDDNYSSTTSTSTATTLRRNSKGSKYQSKGKSKDKGYKDISTTQICMSCSDNAEALTELRHQLAEALASSRQCEKALKSELAAQAGRLAEAELTVCEKEAAISDKEGEVDELHARLADLQNSSGAMVSLADEVQSLRDEVDVLKPEAKRAEALEEKLERLRTKLEELLPLKEQVRNESQAHKETLSKLLALETETESLRKCRIRVEEYKVQYAEATLQIDELTSRLAAQEEALRSSAGVALSSELGTERAGHRQAVCMLNEELKATQEQLRDAMRGVGVGEGVSELNPVLMMELERLRSENAGLKQKAEDSSEASLDRLSKQYADEKAKTNSLKSTLTATRDTLSASTAAVAQLKFRLMEVETSSMILRSELNETRGVAGAEYESIRFAWGSEVAQIRMTSKEALSRAAAEKSAMVIDYDKKVKALRNELTSLRKSLVDEQASRRVVEEEGTGLKSELEEQTKRLREMEADLDQERLKRRRVEREKKFHEAEALKLKTQSQSHDGVGIGGGDIEGILREMRTMQSQLDDAQDELKRLKSETESREQEEEEESTPVVGLRGQGPKRVLVSQASAAAISDRRIELLTRERRELLAKNLEDSREKMELSQKNLFLSNEVAALNAKVTKLNLERERAERKYIKALERRADGGGKRGEEENRGDANSDSGAAAVSFNFF